MTFFSFSMFSEEGKSDLSLPTAPFPLGALLVDTSRLYFPWNVGFLWRNPWSSCLPIVPKINHSKIINEYYSAFGFPWKFSKGAGYSQDSPRCVLELTFLLDRRPKFRDSSWIINTLLRD